MRSAEGLAAPVLLRPPESRPGARAGGGRTRTLAYTAGARAGGGRVPGTHWLKKFLTDRSGTVSLNPMGRPRAFSESDVVVSASAVFARRGFAATSVDDLVRATGVGRASLYGAFGSKDGLFQRCLSGALAALGPGSAPDPTSAPDGADPAGGAGAPESGSGPTGPTGATGEPGPAGALDLVLVSLMELAPDDDALADKIGRALRRAGVSATDLGERLLARADL